MPKWFMPAAAVCGVMFAVSPLIIANAPYEATMGLVQKIFYYHMPSAWMFLIAAVTCGVIYALLPYHFWRGEGHIFLSAYYAVPLGCWLILRVLARQPMAELSEGAGSVRSRLRPRSLRPHMPPFPQVRRTTG